MSRFQLSRSWRPLTLVAVAILVGASLVQPVAAQFAGRAATPAALQTRVASCQGLNFHPIDNLTPYSYTGSELFQSHYGDGFFLCDPKLPDRAVVTKVQFTLRDADFVGEVRYCALYRSGLTVANATTEGVVATVPTTGYDVAPGIVRKSTSSIAFPVVDNASWAYYLQCQIHITDPTGYQLIGIYGADVVYQISAANG